MDPSAKGNVLMFFGAMLAVAAFWLLVLGATQGSVLRIVLGVVAVVLAVWVFRAYAASRKDE
jgi:hypothetical protein